MNARWTRRRFLQAAGAGVAASALPRALFAAGGKEGKTKRVVLVAFAGGVRSRETIGTPANVPNLTKLASEGVLLPNVATQNVGHYGAALSLFTGCVEVKGIRENARGSNPTIFEVLRRERNLPANQVWLSATGGPQALNYAYSLHPDFGARFGANLISGDGIFNAEFQSILDQFGRPKEKPPAERELLERLRGALEPVAGGPAEIGNDPEAGARIERFILEELTRGSATRSTGPGAQDGKALRVALNILRVFKPTLLGIHLGDCDVAHRSFNNYVEVIRRNDEALGQVFEAVRADEELRATTAILVCPEFGRDRDLNERNGLDHGDGSEDLQRIAAVAWGPDFKKGKTLGERVEWTALAPTVASLFGVKVPTSPSKPIRALLA
ncbi:MAG TPA: hypothetical protein VFI25_03255 [Planctomycetota bacterium]|jgi:uncharacterized protein (DUF1501 family)|nr:hypothetical protein [Planctomycetota bacterium]